MATYWVDPYIEAPINGSAGAAGTTARGAAGTYSTPWNMSDLFGQYFPGTTDDWGTHLAPGDEIRFKGFSSSDFFPAGNAKSWNPSTFSGYVTNGVVREYRFHNDSHTQYLPIKTANKDGTVRHFNPYFGAYLRAGISTTWEASVFQLDTGGYTTFDTNYMLDTSTINTARNGNQSGNSYWYIFGSVNLQAATNSNWSSRGSNNGHSGEFVTITAGWDSETTQNGQTHIVFDQSFSLSSKYFRIAGDQVQDNLVWAAPQLYWYPQKMDTYTDIQGLSVRIGGLICSNYAPGYEVFVKSGPYNSNWDSYGTTPTLPGTQQIGDIIMNEYIFGSYAKFYMRPNNNTATLDIPELNHGYQHVEVYMERRHYHNGNYPSNNSLTASDLNVKFHFKLKRFMSNYYMRLLKSSTWYYTDRDIVVDFTFDNDWFIRQGIQFSTNSSPNWIIGTETIGTEASSTETTAGIIKNYDSSYNKLEYLGDPTYYSAHKQEVVANKVYSDNTSAFKKTSLKSGTPYKGAFNYFFSEWIIANGENINNVSVAPATWSEYTAYSFNVANSSNINNTQMDKTPNGSTQYVYRNSASAYIMNEPLSGRSVTMMSPVNNIGTTAVYYRSSDFNNNYTFKLWGESNGLYYCKGFEIPLWDYSTGSNKTLSTTFTTSTNPGIDVWLQIIGFTPLGVSSAPWFLLYEIPATVSGTNLTFSQVISNDLINNNFIARLEGKILLKKTSSSIGHVATSNITVI